PEGRWMSFEKSLKTVIIVGQIIRFPMFDYNDVVNIVSNNALKERFRIRNRSKPDHFSLRIVVNGGPVPGHNHRISRGVRAEPDTGLNFRGENLINPCHFRMEKVRNPQIFAGTS